jgi:hypothetical protein
MSSKGDFNKPIRQSIKLNYRILALTQPHLPCKLLFKHLFCRFFEDFIKITLPKVDQFPEIKKPPNLAVKNLTSFKH